MMAYVVKLAIVILLMAATAVSPQSGDKGQVFTNDGSLVLPSGFRSWVFIGGPITPNGLNDGGAPFPEFHSVYIEVAWGTFARFVAYTGQLNWFLPKGTITTLAIVATCAETILGFLLLLGWQTRTAALLSGVLLLLFPVTMAGAAQNGRKTPAF